MSSMRNAVQRRNHRERAQPAGRERWGLLEKHKDYALRAKDHKRKQAELKRLREKAAMRNPDEFSFKMLSSRVDKLGRRLGSRGNVALSNDAVKLLKTQDAAYLRTMLQQTRKEREQLEQKLIVEEGEDGVKRVIALKDAKQDTPRIDQDSDWDEEDEEAVINTPKRIVFADNEDEIEAIVKGGKTVDNTRHQSNVSGKVRTKRQAAAEEDAENERIRDRELIKEHHGRLQRKLGYLRKKERELALVEQELGLQRDVMNNNIGGISKDGHRIKLRQRKR